MLDRILEITGFSLGLLYLYWEYHASIRMWAVGVLMPMVSFWVYYRAGLYADCGMNVYYFCMAVYGWIAWTRSMKRNAGGVETEKKEGKEGLPITRVPARMLAVAAAAFCVVYALIAWWLVCGTDSTVPYLDALTTALSIVGTWMLTRKYIEQWYVWIAVDTICSGLYWYKDRPFYALLYAIYTAVAIFGYRKWHRMMQARQEA